LLIGSRYSVLLALTNLIGGVVLSANQKRILDRTREVSAKVKMLVFIYHLKTSFEQGHLIEEFLSRYRDVLWLRFSMLQFK